MIIIVIYINQNYKIYLNKIYIFFILNKKIELEKMIKVIIK